MQGRVNMVYHAVQCLKYGDNVDGKHPAPVGMVNLTLTTEFHACNVASMISEPSTI